MSYDTIATSATDSALIRRIAACAAQEGAPGNASAWASEHTWEIVSAPEIEQAYAYALGQLHPAPGQDAGVVTDAMILAKVQPMIEAET